MFGNMRIDGKLQLFPIGSIYHSSCPETKVQGEKGTRPSSLSKFHFACKGCSSHRVTAVLKCFLWVKNTIADYIV